ncbi:MAG: TonB-dependent receptor [Pseudomonadota bacterium]
MPSSLHGAPLRAPRLHTLALALASTLHGLAMAQSTVVVTGNPLGSSLSAPASVLAGDGLALRRAGTLGETLDGLPGVAASGFGPQASRPVIRGLDGDRIRLLDNGGASADASNLSFDHAVALDPLVVERLEVLRGPAALLYGGNATGGVVNALDNRIPRTALAGLGGRAELRLGGAARETAAAALLEAGAGGLNWHADVARRLSGNLDTPAFNPPVDGVPGPTRSRVANSDGTSEAAAVGGSWADAQGFVGAAVDGLRNDYGVTVDPEVRIRLRRDRLQLAGERRGLAGPFSSLQLQASHTRYQHQELEGDGAVGTTFRSTGQELRLQAHQAPLPVPGGSWRGLLGMQLEGLDFSALGDEAFVPGTQTRSQALFTLQELALGTATLQAGARLERVRVHSDGDGAASAEPRFGPAANRDFSPRSLSLGLQAPLASGWRASATVGSTQRAPAYYELFADGLHVATGAFERGDPAQRLERSRHLELGLEWQRAGHSLRAAVWQTRFANYIALDATGATVPVDDEDGGSSEVPVYHFSGVPARLQGGEIEARSRLDSAALLAGWALQASASLDWVRGDNQRSGQPLPRLAPIRLQAGLEAARGAWRAGVQLRHAARQDRVPDNDQATPGWTTLDLWASWRQRLGPTTDAQWTLKLGNLGDALAYNASALRMARTLSPAGGRALQASVRIGF